ncbi:hypothetical protein SDC9_24918 [bioreactor metagenome]|uniref:DUF177 domain-containing protein n=1 Tax=bioreactor metagenome TaxID=1076179 RepID=A0A644UJD8_9ZZZZ|nr:DUF177 domain-containing protein [Lentimicrobium sp.]MEA5108957.1 DUF177 domain-containing protein [Lentimicrobium sp.]
MDYLKQFVIPFVGLNAGNHRFNYVIDDKFFGSFDYGEIREASVQVDLEMNKMDRMLVLNFQMKGTIRVTCSRCLDEFDLPVGGKEEYFIRFGQAYSEEDDNVLIIPENETHIDISSLIFDYLHLMVPYRVVHPENEEGESTCNPEILKRLNELSSHGEPDSPWDKLKDLNFE